jgi:hypothetical protein
MKCLYIDCCGGISGDMMLGALIDSGVPLRHIKQELKKLGVGGYTLKASRTSRSAIACTKAHVRVAETPSSHHHHTHPHRTYSDIRHIICDSALKETVKKTSCDIFHRLARAEAAIHRKKVSDVHFHEVGAVDSIVDIVGCAVGLDYLAPDYICASSVPLGSGVVTCRHGTIPVPVPASLALLKGVPTYGTGISAELVTPTGAALLTTVAAEYGPFPPLRIDATGCGAGSRELEQRPNMVRLVIGDLLAEENRDTVSVIEANIDDMNPEWAGYAQERLLEEGALDVLMIPAYMKKNRPGLLMQVIAPPERFAALSAVLLAETSSGGIRSYTARRTKLARKHITVETDFGPVRAKVFDGPAGKRVVPEYEVCRELARSHDLPLQEIYALVTAAAVQKRRGKKS